MEADVAIIGFGPTGAALAGLLGRRGVRVIVIEKDCDVFPQPRAAHVDHTGLRTVQELGCLDAMLPRVIRNQSLDLVTAKHELLLRVDAGQESVSGLPTSVYFYQPEFDRTLRETVATLDSVEVRLGEEMTHFISDANGVTVQSRDSEGSEHVYRVGWLVGCDGAWSPVREEIGSKLRSLNFDERWFVLDLRIDSPQPNIPKDRVVQVCDPERPHLTTPISHDRQRFEFMLLPGEQDDEIRTPGSISRLLADWLEPDNYVVERSAIYTFHGLVAHPWRVGRVLIAGDAAHQMPPFLGQGMCSGLRDASNLAWKLAAVVRGDADQELLDTYEAERSPHVGTIVKAAIEFGRLVCMTDHAEAAARDKRLLSKGQTSREQAAFTLPRLERGPLVLAGGGGLSLQPQVNGKRLDDIVGQRFLVIARDKAALGESATWWRDEMGACIMSLAEINDPSLDRWMDRYDAQVAVIRPDRYVLGTASSLLEITKQVAHVLRKDRDSLDRLLGAHAIQQ